MAENSQISKKPLVVDLDGTLTPVDTLFESVIEWIRYSPFNLFLLPFLLLRGKVYFKNKIAQSAIPNPALLPYRKEVIEFIKAEKDKGREIILATASHMKMASAVAAHLDIFDNIIASEADLNFKGAEKLRQIQKLDSCKNGFDYIGDSSADLEIWKEADNAIIVEPSKNLLVKAKKETNVAKVFEYQRNPLKTLIREMRVYQWSKNILIFLPLLMAHALGDINQIGNAVMAFLAFSFCASSVYITNDLLDLESDRKHPRKRKRPLASGDISIFAGSIWIFLLLATGLTLTIMFQPLQFLITLLIYLTLTTLYSSVLKKIYIIDIIILAGLYTIRIMSGAFAVEVPLTPWMLAFSMFVFLSLAILKRYTELYILRQQNMTKSSGRGYRVEDIDLLIVLGPASGYLSALVLVLYTNSEEVVRLYENPEILWAIVPVLLYWITRIWFLAHRGKMHDDPIVFTGKDTVSYILGAILALLIIGAAI